MLKAKPAVRNTSIPTSQPGGKGSKAKSMGMMMTVYKMSRLRNRSQYVLNTELCGMSLEHDQGVRCRLSMSSWSSEADTRRDLLGFLANGNDFTGASRDVRMGSSLADLDSFTASCFPSRFSSDEPLRTGMGSTLVSSTALVTVEDDVTGECVFCLACGEADFLELVFARSLPLPLGFAFSGDRFLRALVPEEPSPDASALTLRRLPFLVDLRRPGETALLSDMPLHAQNRVENVKMKRKYPYT